MIRTTEKKKVRILPESTDCETFLMILFIHVKCYQKFASSLYLEDRPTLHLPLNNATNCSRTRCPPLPSKNPLLHPHRPTSPIENPLRRQLRPGARGDHYGDQIHRAARFHRARAGQERGAPGGQVCTVHERPHQDAQQVSPAFEGPAASRGT